MSAVLQQKSWLHKLNVIFKSLRTRVHVRMRPQRAPCAGLAWMQPALMHWLCRATRSRRCLLLSADLVKRTPSLAENLWPAFVIAVCERGL